MSIPKLETTLDTSSLFGEDMFDFVGSKKDKVDESSRDGFGSITPTAPKIASNSIITPVCIASLGRMASFNAYFCAE
jgi:hypothetical protein